jgi:glycosyltransferase involved in cell wall biosynthesis
MVTRSMLRRADYVITASEEIRQILIGLGGKPEQISAIHTGVDTDFFRPMPKLMCRKMLDMPAEADLFIFVGRLHIWKGIRELLTVARKCPSITFVFIGPGEIPKHPDNCLFAGVKSLAEVRTWLNAADCFILPTYTDAVPAAVMEAFACGIPAITTDIGGCPEIVEQEKNGLLVPVRDAERLREAVVWISNHPEDRVHMGKNARKTAVSRYDHRILTRRLVEVQRALIR